MTRLISIFILLLSLKQGVGQETLKVDYSEIKQKIHDKNSSFFYPKLLKKFDAFDNSLTTEEYMYIYYGFSFQEAYLNNQPDEKILSGLEKAGDYENLVIECKKILKANPVSLEANNLIGYALFKIGRSETEWRKYQNRYRAIRKVIATSGDGQSCETALKVIYVSDEYNMLYTYFDVEKLHAQKLVGLCDRFEIDPTKYLKSKEIYFDISRRLLRAEELRKKSEKQ